MTENINYLTIEDFVKTATQEQEKLLSDLYDAVEEEIEITEKINGIYRSIDKGICPVDGGVVICENEDDATMISLGLKYELKIVRSEIGTLLKKAVNELDMGNVGIIKRQYNNYVK